MAGASVLLHEKLFQKREIVCPPINSIQQGMSQTAAHISRAAQIGSTLVLLTVTSIS